MPVDKWLIGYLLSFGAQVEIIEPAYLKAVWLHRHRKFIRKINLDKRCQDICVIINRIATQLYISFEPN